MPVPNQIQHRENYRAQLEAGTVGVNPKPGQPVAAPLPPRRKQRKPRDGEKLTLGQRLGLQDMPTEWPEDDATEVAPALPSLAPPTPVKATTAAEVSTEAVEDVEVDPPQCDEEIADIPETPSTLKSFDFGRPATAPTRRSI